MAVVKSGVVVFLMMMVMTGPMAEAQVLGGLVAPILGLVNIGGIVPCAINVIGGIPRPFPNAQVVLRCGNTTVANVTTNGLGSFSILLGITLIPLPIPLSNCSLVVTTPLSTCNPMLPSVGGLVSPLLNTLNTTVVISTGTAVSVINLIPLRFAFNLTIGPFGI